MSTLRPTNFKPTFFHIHIDNHQRDKRPRPLKFLTTNQPNRVCFSNIFIGLLYRISCVLLLLLLLLFIEQINSNNLKLQCNANCEPTRTITIYLKIEEMNSFYKMRLNQTYHNIPEVSLFYFSKLFDKQKYLT